MGAVRLVPLEPREGSAVEAMGTAGPPKRAHRGAREQSVRVWARE